MFHSFHRHLFFSFFLSFFFAEPSKSWGTGLLICIISGVFSSGLNIAISFGSKMEDLAKDYGTPAAFSDNAEWGLAVGGGFLVNAIYCMYRLTRVCEEMPIPC